jgi:hypothetical protein
VRVHARGGGKVSATHAHTHTPPVAVCAAGKATWAIKSKVAVLLAAVVRQQGASAYTALVPQLLNNADSHTLQAGLNTSNNKHSTK